MTLKPFALERYFARHEFSAKYLLSSSDCDGLRMSDVLALADAETRTLWDTLSLGYTESQGLPLLRREIASLYTGISEEQVLEVVPEEGIFLAMNAILEAGDQIVCTFPGYQSLYQVAESLGCVVTKWMPEENNGWEFDVNFLRQSITAQTKLIVVNFPHNPTGFLPSRAQYEEIVAIARNHGIYLFSDEMYRFLEYDPADRLPSAVELYEKAITLFGMSKTFSLAGLRTGWVITKDATVYERMLCLKDYTTICPSAPAEILALIALRARETIIQGNLEKIKRNLVVLERFFESHSDVFSWTRTKAGTIGFPKIHVEEGAERFCERLIHEAQIMLLPSTVYGFGDHHVRIGFGRQNLPIVLDTLSKFLDA